MTVAFFRVDGVLNFPETDAKAPSGRLGVVDRLVKNLREKLSQQPVGTQLVLYGSWADDWNFDEEKCTPDGKYLIKKLDRRGLHIVDKATGDQPILEYVERKHVDHYVVIDFLNREDTYGRLADCQKP